MKNFILLSDVDRRVIIDTACILSIEEETKDGIDYITVVTPQSIFYFTNYARDQLVLKITTAIQLAEEPDIPIGKPKLDNRRVFFTFPVKGKYVSVKIDNIDFIEETNMKDEYYFEVSTKDGHIYTCTEVKVDDDLLRNLDRQIAIIDCNKHKGA